MASFEFDPFSFRLHEDPYPVYARLRDEAPLYRNEQHGFWILSRYADCKRAVSDVLTYSSAAGISLEAMREQLPMVITMDPPSHSRLRHKLSGIFTPTAVAPLEDHIRALARGYLGRHLAAGRIDIVKDFSAYLPMAIIRHLIGWPKEDDDRLRSLFDHIQERGEDDHVQAPESAAAAQREVFAYMEQRIAERRAGASADDLLGYFLKLEDEGALTHEEVLGQLNLLTLAGNETTTKLIGNMAYRLWQNPDGRALIARDRSLIPSAIEETLRFDGPSQMVARTLTRDVTLYGRTMRAGDKVGILFISGNRDERHYRDPERYDVTRNPRDHLGFGYGLHACLGAALARLETRIVFEEILGAMPNFEIDEAAIVYQHSPHVRGFKSVPATFAPRKTAGRQ